MKRALIDNLKNIRGWKTDRKIVVISVDDYGNVRLDSKQARENMDKAGLKIHSRFDAYDTLETRQDLEALYEVLTSVKDKHGKHAVFTPFALPCNINFEAMAEDGYKRYIPELLPQTYRKLEERHPDAYIGAWELWQEGIEKGIMAPQFHGREHFNLKVFEEKLAKRDEEVLTALENRSYTSITDSGYDTISYTAAFEFDKFSENDRFENIIEEGLAKFQKVYGYPSTHFNPPGGREHPIIHAKLKDCGIDFLDTPFIKKEHQGNGNYRTTFNYTGKNNQNNQIYLVRNVVFEPTDERNIDWVYFCLKQIETAFKWRKPAIISSHRVNFCGFISEKNRSIGLTHLNNLLGKIKKKWPDVEFLATNELGKLISKEK